MQQSNGSDEKSANKKSVVVGSTWSNVNIDLDNLLGKKDSKGIAPSMNQLKSANTSPTHQQKPSMASPLTSPNGQNYMGQKPMFFNASQQQPGNLGNFSQENNNNFNRYNAFQ